jgi:nucleotide-binding universal stress UspA family protein
MRCPAAATLATPRRREGPMARWRRIACAVDFSRTSREAMERAAELARDLAAELVLVHVEDRVPPADAGDTLATVEAVERIPLEIERQLGDWAAAAEAIAGGPVEQALLRGDPAAEIVRFAAERGADAIVLGTHGRGVPERLVFGSVAEAVVRDAGCSTIVERGAPASGAMRATG